MRVSSDDRCRVQSRELFKPNTRYEGEVRPDGIHLVELAEKRAAPARLIRRKGRTLIVTERQITDEDVRRAMESFP